MHVQAPPDPSSRYFPLPLSMISLNMGWLMFRAKLPLAVLMMALFMSSVCLALEVPSFLLPASRTSAQSKVVAQAQQGCKDVDGKYTLNTDAEWLLNANQVVRAAASHDGTSAAQQEARPP